MTVNVFINFFNCHALKGKICLKFKINSIFKKKRSLNLEFSRQSRKDIDPLK